MQNESLQKNWGSALIYWTPAIYQFTANTYKNHFRQKIGLDFVE